MGIFKMIEHTLLNNLLEETKYSLKPFIKSNILNFQFDNFVNKKTIEYKYFNSPFQFIFDNSVEFAKEIKRDFLNSDTPEENNTNTITIVPESNNDLESIDNLDNFISNQSSVLEIPNYDKLYVFSDSLADTGNIFNATSATQAFNGFSNLNIPVLPPSQPYFNRRFSNGLLWIEQLANELNIDLTPSTELSTIFPDVDTESPLTFNFQNGFNVEVSPYFNGKTTEESVNFAFGGAKTGIDGAGEFGDFIPGLQQQVEWFVEDHQLANKTADSDGLYVISAGGNDYRDGLLDPAEIVNNIGQQIQSLYNIGARDFLISNLGNLANLPETPPQFADFLTGVIQVHNNLLDQTINQLEDSLTGINIVTLDFNGLFDDLIANPSDYGLTNVTDSYLDPITFTPTVGANPDEYLFYDTVHPTAAVHEIINDFALTTLAMEI